MSGLLNTQRPCLRAQSRSSIGVSPSSGGGPHVRQAELGERAELVGGQRLGRREVERGGPRVGGERGEHRQLVGQRLARRGAGRHHHVPPGVGQLGRVALVGPRRAHAVVDQRVAASARAPSSGQSRSRPARAGTRTTWRSGESSSPPATAPPSASDASPASGRRGPPPRPRPASYRRDPATLPGRGARPRRRPVPRRSPRARAPAGRSRAPARIRLPRPRPPSSRPPTVAHEPPGEPCRPVLGQTSRRRRDVTAMSRAPAERRDDQGSRPDPVRDATVTGAGAGTSRTAGRSRPPTLR